MVLICSCYISSFDGDHYAVTSREKDEVVKFF